MKSIIRGVIFLITGVVLLQGLAFVAKSISPDGTLTFLLVDHKHVEQVLKNRSTIDAIVLGNSHGDDIDFSSTIYNGYSLARAWGDFFETQYYLKYLVPRLPNLKAVFIPVAYFSFDWDNSHITQLMIRRSQVYSVIPSWTFIPGDIKNFVVGRGTQLFPFQTILRQDNWQGVIYALFSGKTNNLVDQVLAENCGYMEASKLAEFSETRVMEQIQFAKQVHLTRPTIRDDTYDVVIEIINYLRSHKIRLFFFTPPYYEEYTKDYLQNDSESVTTMREMMTRLQGEFGVSYYDYSADDRFVSDFTLFKDGDHLNLCGRRLFSEYLDKSISDSESAP
jgi:hypothetical protein